MKTLICALLLGIASGAFAANGEVAPVRTPKVIQTDMTKRKIMVPDFSAEAEINDEDFENLQKYSGMATDENVAFIRNMQNATQDDPEKLAGQLKALGLNVQGVDQEEALRDIDLGASHNNIEELHKQALEQLERASRPNMNQQPIPIQQIPTIEEIKEMGLDPYLPDGWEEALKNSEEFQAEMSRRRAAGVKGNVKQNTSTTAVKVQTKQQRKAK